MARPTLTYDPALDGLRAVAVMAVMIYHGFLGWGGGGFLGVDLFFVLSGYLITTLLLLEHRGTGTIALGAFWFRRAKRLLPGLFLVLAWISVYASFFAPEGQLDTLRRETIATLFYVANWELITSGESYFEQFLSPSPLRHVWSLAIEEQWYLVWPLVCAFGLGIRSSRWRGWVPTLAAVAVGSAVVMALLVRGTDDTNRAYYGTDARVQALVIGAVLAFVLFARRTGTRPMRSDSPLVSVLGGVGLAGFVVLVAGVGDTDRWMYYGGFSLVAIVGAALVAGASIDAPGNVVRRLLAIRPLPEIGLLSYSLYLWHWPIYVFLTPQRTNLDGYGLFLYRVSVTVAAASASYFLVERPIRQMTVDWRRMAVASLATIAALGLTISLVTTSNARPTAAVDDLAATAPGATRVFVVGDSVYFELVALFPRTTYPDVDVRAGTTVGCGILSPDDDADRDHCFDLHARWEVQLETVSPNVVVIPFSTWDLADRTIHGRDLEWRSSEFQTFIGSEIDEAIDVLTADRGEQVVLLTLPCTAFNAGEDVPNRDERTQWLNDVLADYVAQRDPAEVVLFDVSAWSCPTGTYQPSVGEVELHRDGTHYTSDGALAFWDWFMPELDRVLDE